jgi:hypothetical protein
MMVELRKWDGPLDEMFVVELDGDPSAMVYKLHTNWMRSGHMDHYPSRDDAVAAVVAERTAARVSA